MSKICVIGSANIDSTSFVEDFPNEKGKVDQIGETKYSPGGKGSNQAVAASRLGSEVTFVGCVANDKSGQAIIRNFEKEGINTSFIHIIDEPGVQTDGRTIMVKDGENRMFGNGKCISRLTPDIVNQSIKAIDESDIVMIQLKMPEDTIIYLINLCNELGKRVIVNPAPEDKIDVLVRNELLDKVSYITPNEKEAFYLSRYIRMYEGGQQITGDAKNEIKQEYELSSIEQRSREYMDLVSKQSNVIITMSKRGAMYNNNGKYEIVPTYERVCVDDTGAGDTFNGAFATKIANGCSVSESIDYGNKAASIKVQYECAQLGMPTAEKIAELEKKGCFNRKKSGHEDIDD